MSRPSVLPSVSGTTSAPGWRVRSPVNASPWSSRATRMTRGRCGSLLLHWLGDKGGRRTGYADFGRFLFHVTGIDHPSHGRLPRRHGDGAAAGLGRRSAAFSRTSRRRFVPGRFCSADVVGITEIFVGALLGKRAWPLVGGVALFGGVTFLFWIRTRTCSRERVRSAELQTFRN